MNATSATSVMHRQPHPSPQRERVGGFAIWFAILAAPVAWSLQLLVNVPLAAHACYPHRLPLAVPIWSNLGSVTTIIELVAVAICLVAAGVAWRNWLLTHGEKPGGAHHLMEGGDGRTRFMAMVGLLCSGLFLLAVLFAIGMVVVVPPCS